MTAALRALRARKPKKLVGAVAVASPEAARALLHECDAMICLNAPAEFHSVGRFFDDFSQVTDDDVIAILRQRCRESIHSRLSAAAGPLASLFFVVFTPRRKMRRTTRLPLQLGRRIG